MRYSDRLRMSISEEHRIKSEVPVFNRPGIRPVSRDDLVIKQSILSFNILHLSNNHVSNLESSFLFRLVNLFLKEVSPLVNFHLLSISGIGHGIHPSSYI